MQEKNSIVLEELKNLSVVEKVIIVVMLPIFVVVAGIEHVIAKLTGSTYNEVNIVVYYLMILLSWAVMADYICGLPFLTLVRNRYLRGQA